MHPVETAARELGFESFSGWTDGRMLIWTTDEEKAEALRLAGATVNTITTHSGRVQGFECCWNHNEVRTP